MKTSDFYYDLPKELIAQEPSEERDLSRMLRYSLKGREIVLVGPQVPPGIFRLFHHLSFAPG